MNKKFIKKVINFITFFAFGVVGLISNFLYLIEIWKSLNVQGLSNLYISVSFIVSILVTGGIFIALIFVSPFLGSILIQDKDHEKGLLKVIFLAIGGSIAGYFLSTVTILAWFSLISYIHG